jgi:predicted Abi (CAAX) family protease
MKDIPQNIILKTLTYPYFDNVQVKYLEFANNLLEILFVLWHTMHVLTKRKKEAKGSPSIKIYRSGGNQLGKHKFYISNQ